MGPLDVNNRLRHLVAVCVQCTFIFMFTRAAVSMEIEEIDGNDGGGRTFVLFLFCLRLLPIIALPIAIMNFLGFIMLSMFPRKAEMRTPAERLPFIYFRVVTKGLYPNLVSSGVRHNLQVCTDVGLKNYIIEVVTDKTINLSEHANTREVLVPESYKTQHGSLFKARALQYCLDQPVNEDDWIVHLDEETLLTEDVVASIANFVVQRTYHFGQGVITYASNDVVNWITTLSDSVRVGMDYGMVRFSLGIIHKPLFNWKGSFIVANVGAEKVVSFDHGPECSLAEDCCFAMSAIGHGYKFNYITGEMHEQSSFTISDFIKQRTRWVRGVSLAFRFSKAPWKCKIGIFVILANWFSMPVILFTVPITASYPVPLGVAINTIASFMTAIFLFQYTFGTLMSLKYSTKHVVYKYAVSVLSALIIPISVILENMAIISFFVSRKQRTFYIIQKESRPVFHV